MAVGSTDSFGLWLMQAGSQEFAIGGGAVSEVYNQTETVHSRNWNGFVLEIR